MPCCRRILTPFVPTFQKYLYQGLPPHKLSQKITQMLKSHLRRRLLIDSRAFLRRRLAQVPWLFSSSSAILDTLHLTPLKVIPSFLRLAILRWMFDSEPDLHFRLRPHISRSAPCVCGCGEYSSIYPFGVLRGAYHSSHLSFDHLYTFHLSTDLDGPTDFLVGPRHPPLPRPNGMPPHSGLSHGSVTNLTLSWSSSLNKQWNTSLHGRRLKGVQS